MKHQSLKNRERSNPAIEKGTRKKQSKSCGQSAASEQPCSSYRKQTSKASNSGKKKSTANRGSAGKEPTNAASLTHFPLWAYLDHLLRGVSDSEMLEIHARFLEVIQKFKNSKK